MTQRNIYLKSFTSSIHNSETKMYIIEIEIKINKTSS